MIILYSTDCPKCKILETKLNDAAIHYEINKDIDEMQAKGFTSVPMLDMNGEVMNFSQALAWLRANPKEDECGSCKIGE